MEQRRRQARLYVVCVTAAATGVCLGLALSAGTSAAIQRIRRSWTFAAMPVEASPGLEPDAALVLSFVHVTDVTEFEAQIDRVAKRFDRARLGQVQVPRWRMFKSSEETVDHCVLYAFWISPAAARSRSTALSSILRPFVSAGGNGQPRISSACSGERSLSLSFVSQIPR